MKKLLFAVLSVFLASPVSGAVGFAQETKPGNHYETIKVDGSDRTYLLHIPKNYDGKTFLPLAFNLHSGVGNAKMQESKTGMTALSDREGFILVYPEADKRYGHWNDGRGLSKANDVKFISMLADSLAARLSVDKNRIYACGGSNGGMMCHRLGLELSGKLAAIVSIAGSISDALPASRPSSCIPVMEIHGDKDALVPWNGGKAGMGGTVVSVGEAVKRWQIFNNASTIPKISEIPDVDKSDKCRSKRYDYLNGDGIAVVSLVKIEGGGHGWPRGAKSLSGITKDFDATLMAWDFLKVFRKSFGNGKKSLNSGGIEREYFVRKPDNSKGLPVVFLLHGGGGTSAGILIESGMAAKADRESFILVTPEAVRPKMSQPASFTLNPQTWNDGSGRFSESIDDVGFISSLIDKICIDCKADKTRIFVTGFSNGASMTNRIGAELSSKVKAVAPVSGHLWMDYKTIEKTVSVCAIIGTDDPLNPIEGGDVRVPGGKVERHPPVYTTIEKWSKLLSCDQPSEKKTPREGVELTAFKSCKGGASIEYWTVKGLGHVWPGASGSLLPKSMVGNPSNLLDANNVIWDFFKSRQ